ncbi:DegV family protein with EDD domain [Ezakiella coagulans]|uniref:DegV family protein with EDD domain n=1 Tax=Ezakiella coagulans TaxID=46507 RepID=A0A2U1E4E6_9FIRM|nr:DegV family protein [Ezakiella coagulans]PVY94820.1 DegV family protein with EDD domain [Ezakiella coagulans]
MVKIVVDSCCELNPDMTDGLNVSFVPFKLGIGNDEILDDENLNIEEFRFNMSESKEAVRTACPSPQDFLEKFEGDTVYIITITGELSGTYQSAMIAKEMYMKENPESQVHVFDSRSAVAGETAVFLNLADCIKAGKSFEETVSLTEELIQRSVTIINLASLSNLAKNGRIPKIAGKLSKVLNIRMIAKAKDGKIVPVSIERGLKRSIKSLVNKAMDLCDKSLKTAIVISQAGALDAAKEVKEMLLKSFPDRIIEITGMKGLSSTYAEEGGLVLHL